MHLPVVLVLVLFAVQAYTASLSNPHIGVVVPHQYIVVLKDGFSSTARDTLVESLQKNYDVEIRKRFSHVMSGFSATMNKRAVIKVMELDEVKYVEEIVIGGITEVASWGLDRVDARTGLDDRYNPKYSGEGVSVYVLDTGIRQTHNDFGRRAAYGYDAVDDDFESDDCHGHGTHCAGTTSGTEYGVAKLSNVYGSRVVNCLGIGPIDWVIAGMDWVLAEGIRPAVLSMSLGYPRSQALDDAVARVNSGGFTVVGAAGNGDNDACLYSPAGAEDTYTVAATDDNDIRAYFSSYGSCVSIFAPGVDIVSAGHLSDDDEAIMSGTSMATPHVAAKMRKIMILAMVSCSVQLCTANLRHGNPHKKVPVSHLYIAVLKMNLQYRDFVNGVDQFMGQGDI
ncbi:aqualysin-1-like [Saccoglossus kowalevskii]